MKEFYLSASQELIKGRSDIQTRGLTVERRIRASGDERRLGEINNRFAARELRRLLVVLEIGEEYATNQS